MRAPWKQAEQALLFSGRLDFSSEDSARMRDSLADRAPALSRGVQLAPATELNLARRGYSNRAGELGMIATGHGPLGDSRRAQGGRMSEAAATLTVVSRADVSWVRLKGLVLTSAAHTRRA